MLFCNCLTKEVAPDGQRSSSRPRRTIPFHFKNCPHEIPTDERSLKLQEACTDTSYCPPLLLEEDIQSCCKSLYSTIIYTYYVPIGIVWALS